jgi:glycosyltransferase involved in cell wall biosynthesis
MTCVERVQQLQQRQASPDQKIASGHTDGQTFTHFIGSAAHDHQHVEQPPHTLHAQAMKDTIKTVLMVTVEFPPAQSSGVNRIQSFAHDLAAHGWQVIVLTTTPNVYPQLDNDNQIASSLSSQVFRTKALTSNRIFQIAGRYPAVVTIPDRYWPWLFSAIPRGHRLIKEFNVDCIWSSYPYLSAHLVAQRLAQRSKLPWVADFRDPLQCHYHHGYKHGNAFTLWLERRIVHQATALCFVTEETRDLYRTLYPKVHADKFHVIENGYSHIMQAPEPCEVPTGQHQHSDPQATTQSSKFILLYSGGLYDGHRNPSPLFSAIATLQRQGLLTANNFVLRFRGAGDGQRFMPQLQDEGIEHLVEFLPNVSQREAINEILHADANLLIQGEIFNYQIPAKLYDYLQASAPVLAICPKQSATARRCERIAQCHTAWEVNEIKAIIAQWLYRHRQQLPINNATLTPQQRQQLFSRHARSIELAGLLQMLCTAHTSST